MSKSAPVPPAGFDDLQIDYAQARELMNKHDRAIDALAGKAWASDLLSRISDQGGARKAPSGLLFELRFAFELTRYCPTASPQYEVSGVGDTSVDFRIEWGGYEWFIELVSLNDSDTVRTMLSQSTIQLGGGLSCEGVALDSSSSDLRSTPWGELIRASENIAGKIWDSSSKSPQKFGARTDGRVQALLIDMAGFEGIGEPDANHCREIALGSASIPFEYRTLHPKTGAPVLGLFDDANGRPSAVEFRSRVDMLGFVSEHPEYEQDDEIGRKLFLIPNPGRSDAREIVASFPVRSCESQRNPLGAKD